MRDSGTSRKIDASGRIQIPKSIREQFRIVEHTELSITLEADGSIVLRKVGRYCAICGAVKAVEPFEKSYVCQDCSKKLARPYVRKEINRLERKRRG